MKRKCISVALVLATSVLALPAQTKRTVAKQTVKDKAASVKLTKQMEEKIAQMVTATQKIVFVDSIVVSKKDFLGKYLLNPEAGKVGSYDDVFSVSDQPNAYVHINELGDKCYYSLEDSLGGFGLYTSDIIDGKMSASKELEGIDTKKKYLEANYPFMMADGITLYFAATGEESIGGYDIFVTRFDSGTGKYLKPENIGMPFNSTANDYMLAIDDYGDIGWFATDRGQKAGNVCIYTFIPSSTRELYESDKYTEKQIRNFAALNSIEATWGDGVERIQALQRLEEIPKRLASQAVKPAFSFVVNDDVTYQNYTDFKVQANVAKFKQLQEQQRKLAVLEKAIDNARDYYASASKEKKTAMTDELLKSEHQYEVYEESVVKLEKEIRNSENKALGR